MRRGFTVLEVCVALAIALIAILPALMVLTSASRQSRQTSDVNQAIIVAEKVAETVRVSGQENPHFVEQLERDPSFAQELKVVDGISPFFARLEDTTPPYGRITPGVDPAIDQAQPALYKQVSIFRTAVEAVRRTGPQGGDLLDVTVKVNWDDAHGVARDYALMAALGVPVPNARPPPPPDPTTANDLARAALYPDANGQTLDQAASGAGLDPAVAHALGAVVRRTEGLAADIEAVSKPYEAILDALGGGADPARKARLEAALGRYLEYRLLLSLEVQSALVEPLERLAAATGPVPPGPRLKAAIQEVALLPSRIARLLMEAMQTYATASDGAAAGGLSPRVQTRLFLKNLELGKLAGVTFSPSTDFLVASLDDFRKRHDDRNPDLAQFARIEREACRSKTTLRASYPLPARFQMWDRYLAAVVPAAPRWLSK